jgi:hypothetical protein
MNETNKTEMLLLSSVVIIAAVAAKNRRQNNDLVQYVLLEQRRRRWKKSSFPRYRSPRHIRKTWTEFCETIDDTMFRRMFRMSKDSFERLCKIVCDVVGENTFRPEAFLETGTYLTCLQAANDYNGGFISGELKIALTIRMLAGASYLDLMFGFTISRATLYREFDIVIGWINESFNFQLAKFLKNKDVDSLQKVSTDFSQFSSGVFSGIIGALDGIAIRIRCPSASDGVSDPGNYWTRKQFYALNVQAICDSKKRFLWVSSGHQGATHDSLAFESTKLNQLLREEVVWMRQQGFFLVGDSAYNISPYLLTPYSDANIEGETKDTFNFWQSNARIRIECAFGELVMRWGIFWRSFRFDLSRSGKVINAAMLIHNFLCDEREDLSMFSMFSAQQMYEDSHIIGNTRDIEQLMALVMDNDADRPPGRQLHFSMELRKAGMNFRDQVATLLYTHDLRRPYNPSWKRNEYGHVYYCGNN